MSLDTILDLTNIPPPYVQAFIHSRKEEFDLRSPEEYYATLLAYCEHVRSHETPIPDTRHTSMQPHPVTTSSSLAVMFLLSFH